MEAEQYVELSFKCNFQLPAFNYRLNSAFVRSIKLLPAHVHVPIWHSQSELNIFYWTMTGIPMALQTRLD